MGANLPWRKISSYCCHYQSILSIVIMVCTYITSFPDLSKLYKLLRNIPRGLQAMVAELEEHITKSGRNLLIVVHSAHEYFKIKDLFLRKLLLSWREQFVEKYNVVHLHKILQFMLQRKQIVQACLLSKL